VARAEVPDLVAADYLSEQEWRAPVPAWQQYTQGSRPTIWQPSAHGLPPTLAILDLLQFGARAVGEPTRGRYHEYQNHHHLILDRDAGLKAYVEDVNRILARGGIAFGLTSEGRVERLLPEPMNQILRNTTVSTGDDEADRLLEAAKGLITSPNIAVRRDALEKLWDAFERIKTLEPGADKKAKATALIDRASAEVGPRFKILLSKEALDLTDIGNNFRIRHAETNQEIADKSTQLDYLFFRMLTYLRYVLTSTGRSG